MCDWPVYGTGGYIDTGRRCHNNGLHQAGPLAVCPQHFTMLVRGVLEAVRREAHQQIRDGRATPGGMEDEMRLVLAEIQRKRKAVKYASMGSPPCVYFAGREGYVKIGSTVNLEVRMRTLAAGSSLVPGMTAGPLTLIATVPGGLHEERVFHKRFRRLRVDRNREWFRHEGKLREFLDELTGATDLA